MKTVSDEVHVAVEPLAAVGDYGFMPQGAYSQMRRQRFFLICTLAGRKVTAATGTCSQKISNVLQPVLGWSGKSSAPVPMQRSAWHQWCVIFYVSVAGFCCFYNRAVLSMVVPGIAEELGLSSAQQTTALSSFFYGYVFSNAASLRLLQRVHPVVLMLFAVFFSSLCTVLVPYALSVAGYAGLIGIRVVSGLTQGCLFPSLYGLLGIEFVSDPAARTRGTAILFGMANLGIALNFLLSPVLMEHGGWRLPVTVAGDLGFPWCLMWRCSSIFRQNLSRPVSRGQEKMPSFWKCFRMIISARPFQALVCAHFAHNWTNAVVMAWLPTYFSKELRIPAESLGLSCLPFVIMTLGAPLFGMLAELLLQNHWEVWKVRRFMAVGALLIPAIGLWVFPQIPGTSWPMPLVCITIVMGFTTCASSSVLASPLDLAGPKFSGMLFSITNTICAVPCFLGIELVGHIRDVSGWESAFGSCSVIYIVGFLLYTGCGSAQRLFD